MTGIWSAGCDMAIENRISFDGTTGLVCSDKMINGY
jgi:hypothetical protein